MPEGLSAVHGFEPARYLGKWYEIARMDHWFERGLTQATAEYSLRLDGSLEVLNRGFDPGKGCWKQSRGIARFCGSPDRGSLKVSFFGPFWGAYHIIALDQEHYRYAMVAGPSYSYLWILAREPQIDPEVRDRLLEQARASGFDTAKLIWPG